MYDFLVIPDDGDVWRVTAESRDILAWEKTGRGNNFAEMAEAPSMEAMYHLAWLASRRHGHINGSLTLRQFEESFTIKPEAPEGSEGEAAGVDPTPVAPSRTSSSRSRSRPASPRARGSRAGAKAKTPTE
jgi:hypothetical protein